MCVSTKTRELRAVSSVAMEHYGESFVYDYKGYAGEDLYEYKLFEYGSF
jgi:hypothetical protein